jgi:hypothetical protein
MASCKTNDRFFYRSTCYTDFSTAVHTTHINSEDIAYFDTHSCDTVTIDGIIISTDVDITKIKSITIESGNNKVVMPFDLLAKISKIKTICDVKYITFGNLFFGIMRNSVLQINNGCIDNKITMRIDTDINFDYDVYYKAIYYDPKICHGITNKKLCVNYYNKMIWSIDKDNIHSNFILSNTEECVDFFIYVCLNFIPTCITIGHTIRYEFELTSDEHTPYLITIPICALGFGLGFGLELELERHIKIYIPLGFDGNTIIWSTSYLRSFVRTN